jgi:predicted DNA-binding transcriptional regulator AlpA
VNQITPDEKLLTSAEVAELIGKSKAWLARMRWAGGGIPYRKIGRHVRYQRSVVLDWLNRQPSLTSTSQAR